MCDQKERINKAQQNNDLELQYRLACEYEGKHDYKAALKWYMMLTKYPFAWAEYKVGELLVDPLYNSVRIPDYFQAYQWFKRADDHGCKQAKRRLVDFQLSNIVLNHCVVDLGVVEQICQENNTPSPTNTSIDLSHTNNTISKEIHYLKGEWYRLHDNTEISITHYQRAIPHVGALNRLGELSEHDQDLERAMEYYERAIQLNDYAPAHNNLGILYESQDKVQLALEQFELAARQDYACAYSNIARIQDTLMDENDPQFELQVIEPYKKAVSLGHALSGWALGDIFYNLRNDMKSAFHWWRKAAYLGSKEAQREMSELYRKGIGGVLSVDLQEHLNWFFLSTFVEPQERG